MTMVESIDDITRQARQGSVAAIIQILNERLSDSGVRTRAVLAQGILQLLCEASTAEELDQETLVNRIRHILEWLRPRHIRRVRINSRLVREQQLLWLDEIRKDPEGQLLWHAEITLPFPNPVKVWVEDWSDSRQQRDRLPTATSANRWERDRRQFWRGIIGGAGLSVFLLLLGWVAYDWLGGDWGRSNPVGQVEEPAEPDEEASDVETLLQDSDAPSAATTPATSATVDPPSSDADPFAQAVILAEQAVADGQTASSPAEWLDLASRWQRASDLMAQVPEGDGRYATAQDRQVMYQQNSDQALQQARLLQGDE